MTDDDIPVLRDAIHRKQDGALSQEDIDAICTEINEAATELVDKLLAEALLEAENTLRSQIDERVSDELPALVEKILLARLRQP